jgi:hypothetical protein
MKSIAHIKNSAGTITAIRTSLVVEFLIIISSRRKGVKKSEDVTPRILKDKYHA